jgi:hypothetical protein
MKTIFVKAVFFSLVIITLFPVLLLTQPVISEKDKNSLVYFREEEKLAADAFDYFYEMWSNKLFFSFKSSESKHETIFKELMDYYGIDDPVKDYARGEFTIDTLKYFYIDMISFGSKSLLHSFLAGAEIEERSVYELDNAIKVIENEKLTGVYKTHKSSSEGYLRLFVSKLKDNSVIYQPKYLTGESFKSIVKGES